MLENQIRVSTIKRNRLLQLLASIIFVLLVLKILSNEQQFNRYAASEQARDVTRILVEQAASTAARQVMEQDENGLATMATRLTQHPSVHDVAIYDSFGRLLATSQSYQPLQERMTELLETHPKLRLDARVASIDNDGVSIGFIQMTVSYQTLISSMQPQQEQSENNIRLALLFSLLAGFLLAKSTHKPFIPTPLVQAAPSAKENDSSEDPPKANNPTI